MRTIIVLALLLAFVVAIQAVNEAKQEEATDDEVETAQPKVVVTPQPLKYVQTPD